MIAGFGVACWIAKRLAAGTPPSWISLLILVGLGIGALALRLFGDFYWAFDRGYFLN